MPNLYDLTLKQKVELLLIFTVCLLRRKSKFFADIAEDELADLYNNILSARGWYKPKVGLIDLLDIRNKYFFFRDKNDILPTAMGRRRALIFGSRTIPIMNAQRGYDSHIKLTQDVFSKIVCCKIRRSNRHWCGNCPVCNMRKIESTSDDNLLANCFHNIAPYIIMFFTKLELECFSVFYADLFFNSSHNVLIAQQSPSLETIVNNFLDSLNISNLDLVYYSLFNRAHIDDYFIRSQVSQLMTERNCYQQSYFGLFCFPFFTRSAISLYPPTREGNQKLINSLESGFGIQVTIPPFRVELFNQLNIKPINIDNYKAPDCYSRAGYVNFSNHIAAKLRDIGVLQIHPVFLPDINGLTPLTIAYLSLYHAYMIGIDEIIFLAENLFTGILSIMKKCLLSTNIKKINIPLLYDGYDFDGSYFYLNIEEHAISFSGINDLVQYVTEAFSEYKDIFEAVSYSESRVKFFDTAPEQLSALKNPIDYFVDSGMS